VPSDFSAPVETRPAMTPAEFESAATAEPGWWLTGEGLIHTSIVMDVEGWNLYGHPGNASLTEAQRVLMMWADLVGQVANGGFAQFVENYARSLKLAHALIHRLEWPELNACFDRAFREQAGDPEDPKTRVPVGLEEEPEKWVASRDRFLRHLVRQRRNRPAWWPISARELAAVEARFGAEWELGLAYQLAVHKGEIESGGEQLFAFEPPPSVEADAFDDWFYLDSTREASQQYVGAFIRKHRDELCRVNA
jgi:hypothetical protein